ncbi:MAG: hypothetical protein ACTSVA_03025 [Candidatus Njordarchaeales archaeon]
MRVVIVDILEGEIKPVGPDLQIGYRVLLSVKSPKELKESVKDAPLPPRDGSYLRNLKIWEIINITEKKNAIERILYKASDERDYEISAEAEVTIVARTLKFRDMNFNPIYHLRWAFCAKINIAKK